MAEFTKNLKKVIYFILPLLIYEVIRECAYFFAQTIDNASSESFKLLLAGIVTLPVMIWIYIKENNGLDNHAKIINIKNLNMIKERIIILPLFMGCFFGLFLSFTASWMSANELSGTYQQATQSIFSGETWVQILGAGLIIPAAEEVTFRGLIYKRGKIVFSSTLAATIFSSVLFGLFHGNIVQIIAGFLAGCVMCVLYERYKTIIASVLFHIGFNMPGIILKNIGFYIESKVLMGSLIIISGMASAGCFMWVLKKKKRYMSRHGKFC